MDTRCYCHFVTKCNFGLIIPTNKMNPIILLLQLNNSFQVVSIHGVHPMLVHMLLSQSLSLQGTLGLKSSGELPFSSIVSAIGYKLKTYPFGWWYWQKTVRSTIIFFLLENISSQSDKVWDIMCSWCIDCVRVMMFLALLGNITPLHAIQKISYVVVPMPFDCYLSYHQQIQRFINWMTYC